MRAPARSLFALTLLSSAAVAQTTVKQQSKSAKDNDPIYAEGYIRPPEAVA
jgi:hypothetical protein